MQTSTEIPCAKVIQRLSYERHLEYKSLCKRHLMYLDFRSNGTQSENILVSISLKVQRSFCEHRPKSKDPRANINQCNDFVQTSHLAQRSLCKHQPKCKDLRANIAQSAKILVQTSPKDPRANKDPRDNISQNAKILV